MSGNLIVTSPPLDVDVQPSIAAGLKSALDAIGNLVIVSIPTPIKSGTRGPIAIVETVLFIDKDKLNKKLALCIFKKNIATIADGAPLDPTDTEVFTLLGRVSVLDTDWQDFPTKSVATISNLGLTGKIEDGNLYCQFIADEDITTVKTDSIKANLSGLIS